MKKLRYVQDRTYKLKRKEMLSKFVVKRYLFAFFQKRVVNFSLKFQICLSWDKQHMWIWRNFYMQDRIYKLNRKEMLSKFVVKRYLFAFFQKRVVNFSLKFQICLSWDKQHMWIWRNFYMQDRIYKLNRKEM